MESKICVLIIQIIALSATMFQVNADTFCDLGRKYPLPQLGGKNWLCNLGAIIIDNYASGSCNSAGTCTGGRNANGTTKLLVPVPLGAAYTDNLCAPAAAAKILDLYSLVGGLKYRLNTDIVCWAACATFLNVNGGRCIQNGCICSNDVLLPLAQQTVDSLPALYQLQNPIQLPGSD